jgi:hypothetical protein
MTRKEELLGTFDDVWSRKWESLDNVLKDVSEEEAHYQSPIYADEPTWPGEAPSGTILWYLQHLAQCYIHYRALIIERPAKTADPEPPPANTLEEARMYLHLHRGELRDLIITLREDEFEENIYNDLSVGGVIRMMARHDGWHTGQIAVARRLYRYRALMPN